MGLCNNEELQEPPPGRLLCGRAFLSCIQESFPARASVEVNDVKLIRPVYSFQGILDMGYACLILCVPRRVTH